MEFVCLIVSKVFMHYLHPTRGFEEVQNMALVNEPKGATVWLL